MSDLQEKIAHLGREADRLCSEVSDLGTLPQARTAVTIKSLVEVLGELTSRLRCLEEQPPP